MNTDIITVIITIWQFPRTAMHPPLDLRLTWRAQTGGVKHVKES